MDGKWMLQRLRNLLSESDSSDFMVDRISYDYLYDAACELVNRTKSLRKEQTITTVADQASYDLSSDFMQLYLKDRDNRLYVKVNDGSDDFLVYEKDYGLLYYDSALENESVEIPYNFAIVAKQTGEGQITGAATSNGTSSGNGSTLTDSGGGFSPEVAPGDMVHNTTDGSNGVVLSVTSDTAIVTALFGGTNNDWTSGDSYVINPQGKKQIVFYPPFSEDSYTITVPYLQYPAPVYTDYGKYNFDSRYSNALIMYAAWLYKYRDREPSFGDGFYLHWDNIVKGYAKDSKDSMNARKGFRVNLKKRS